MRVVVADVIEKIMTGFKVCIQTRYCTLYGRRTLVESKEIAQVCENFFRWFQNAGGAEKIMQRRALAPF